MFSDKRLFVKPRRVIIGILFLHLGLATVFAQTSVKGIVIDAKKKEPLPFVNVYFKGATEGVATDLNGKYIIHSDMLQPELLFSFIGYKTITRKITTMDQTIDVRLVPESQVLDEVIVHSGKVKEKYRNKNNPAVDLVREM